MTTFTGPQMIELPLGVATVCAQNLDDTGMQKAIGIIGTDKTVRRMWVFRGEPAAWILLAEALEDRAYFSRDYEERHPGKLRKQAQAIREAVAAHTP